MTTMLNDVWVLAEKPDTIAELCAGARQLGTKVTVILAAPKSVAQEVIRKGADHVYWLGEINPGVILEDYTDTIHQLLTKHKPALVLTGASKRIKLIAARLAARLGTSVLTDVMEFVPDENSLWSKRMVYGGAAICEERSLSPIVIASVGVGVFSSQKEDTGRAGTIEDVAFIVPDAKIKFLEKRVKTGEAVNLAAAKKVVAVGRGISKEEDLRMIEELARLMGAEIACSRPIAEGEDWLPRERYVGVTGVMFKPELYFAIGISGQVQHMVGCNQSKTIFAINKDKAAPIIEQSDYSIVGDLYKVVPVLIEKLKAGQ